MKKVILGTLVSILCVFLSACGSTTMDNGNDTNGIGGDEGDKGGRSRIENSIDDTMDDARKAGDDLINGAKDATDDMMEGERKAIDDASDGIRNATEEMKN